MRVLEWFNQVLQQLKDLTHEDGSPIFAVVRDGPIPMIDQQRLPCVSLTTSTGTVLVALVYVARLTHHQWKYPSSESYEAGVLQYRIQDATWQKWKKNGAPGSMLLDGNIYKLLEYTFYRYGDPFVKWVEERQ